MLEKDSSCDWIYFVDRSFKKLFYQLGFCIGKAPIHFILIPIFVSLLLGTGLQRIVYKNDPEYLYPPTNGQAQTEKRIIETFFPVNYSGAFSPSRFIRIGKLARIFITAQDGESLLRQKVWQEIRRLDQLLLNVSFTYDDEEYNFDKICARWENECYGNDILNLGDQMNEIEAKNVTLSYPIMFDATVFKTYAFPLLFGGIQVSNQSMVSAKALQLNYFVKDDSPKRRERGGLWEKGVLESLNKVDSEWKFIKVARYTGRSIPDEIDNNSLTALPYMIFTAPALTIFAIVSCMMSDCVRSKPWLGLVGVFTSTLGTLTAFGLLSYCGIPLVSLTAAAPFLMLGIGMDDMFVMLAAWRQTRVCDSVPKRMADTYSEAAVSITITSLTDMVSFIIGIITPFPAVQIFSIYTATSVVTTYIFHLCFFGGALALSGYHEAENRHGMFWWIKATPRSKVDQLNSSKMQRLFFTGGVDPNDPQNPLDHQEHMIMVFFRDKWASFLSHPIVKFFVLILFLVYIGLSCWGISQTEEGLELKKIARDDSYTTTFFDTLDNYFTQFPYRVQVVLTGDLNYSNKTVQKKIENMMQEFENSKYTKGGSIFTESWLRSFLNLAQRFDDAGFGLNMTTEKEFIQNLQDYYLGPSSVYSLDVKLNEDQSKIIASRFIIQPVNVSGSQNEWQMVEALRAIGKSQYPNLNVTIFHPYFVFTDQALIVRSTTIQCLAIAGIVMMIIAIIFIPNPICALWVAFSVISIEAGVLGFLIFWGVKLDAVTMLNLIMCVGFAVDFSAHISYAYISTKSETPKGRLKSCLYSLGLPIVQGAISTILGVIALSIAPSYALNNFFKAVFLVMVIAALHGLCIIPVMLSLFGPGSYKAVKMDLIQFTKRCKVPK